MNAFQMQHRQAQYEDSVKTTSTFSSKSFSSNHDTAETNLSAKTAISKDETCYKRSRSYHGKSSKGLTKLWCLAVVIKLVTGSFSLFAYSKYCVLNLDVQFIAHISCPKNCRKIRNSVNQVVVCSACW
jgi:hypothetical protein